MLQDKDGNSDPRGFYAAKREHEKKSIIGGEKMVSNKDLICRTIVVSAVMIIFVLGAVKLYQKATIAVNTLVGQKSQIEMLWDANSPEEFLNKK